MDSELHLFVLWEKSRVVQDQLLDKIGEQFELCRVYEVAWSEGRFAENISRFYGEKLPPDCGKIDACGEAPFLLVVVRDPAPEYDTRLTTKGDAVVNINLFDLKTEVREGEHYGYHIHGTTDSSETDHDLTLLLGVDADAFDYANPGPWDGSIETKRQDIIGADGWASLEEFFYVLNHTVNYVVLRNFESLPDKHVTDEHGDIDLLTDSLYDLRLISNGAPVFDEEYRVHYRVDIAGESVLFDFRYVGDDYYDFSWQRSILDNRVYLDSHIYVPANEDHFYSLLYHALIHKTEISQDYNDKLSVLMAALDIKDVPAGADLFGEDRLCRAVLFKYMVRHTYGFVRPIDKSVIYHRANTNALRGIFSHDVADKDRVFDEIEKIIAGSSDLSSLSTEIARQCVDTDVKRVLNNRRANLLRPFKDLLKGNVLEIGSRFGTLTRYLGECGGQVLSLEGNQHCRRISESRNRDLANVTISSCAIDDLDVSEKYDVITLIGHLDYSVLFCDDDMPFRSLVNLIRSLLAPDGVLILAYDNRLGREAMQDGLSLYDSCLQSLNDGSQLNRGSTVFGKAALADTLNAMSLENFCSFIPLPDFSEPVSILNESAIIDPVFDSSVFFNSNFSRLSHMDDSLYGMWTDIAKNGMAADLANSYMMLISVSNEHELIAQDQLAYHYCVDRRKPFCKETSFKKVSPEKIDVEINSLSDEDYGGDITFEHDVIAHDNYAIGYPLMDELVSVLNKSGWTIKSVAEFLIRYLGVLQNELNSSGQTYQFDDLTEVLPGHCFDAVPGNLIVKHNADVVLIDKEWSLKSGIALGYMIFRALYVSFDIIKRVAAPADEASLSYKRVIQESSRIYGLEMTDDDYLTYVNQEIDFQQWVSGFPRASDVSVLTRKLRTVFNDDMETIESKYHQLKLECQQLQYDKDAAEFAAEALLNSRSWKITTPLRVIKHLVSGFKAGRKSSGDIDDC